MNQKAPLPPNFRPHLWETKQFRRLLLVGIMGVAVLGVLIFDIGPKLTQRYEREPKAKNPNAFVPKPWGPDGRHELKYEGVLDKEQDGTPIDAQDEPYQYLVRSISRMDSAQVAKDAKAVDYQYYSKMPVEMRGQTVKLLALFLTSSPLRVDAAPGGVHFVHRTYLSDLSGSEGYVVDLIEPPPEDMARRTLVRLDAVFLKLGTYEGKKGPVQAPLFVGRSLHTVKEHTADSAVTHLSTALILTVAVGTMLVLFILTSLMFRKPRPSGQKGPAISFATLKS